LQKALGMDSALWPALAAVAMPSCAALPKKKSSEHQQHKKKHPDNYKSNSTPSNKYNGYNPI
jgi:hypothetical protein